MTSTALGTTVNLPIDYTSRDWTSIRSDLINAIPTYLPEWTDTSINDFGIALIELFSYVGDILNYYIDRMANEAFLATAQQRQSILNVAYLIDYSPADATASQATLSLTIRAAAAGFVIPAGTQFSTQSTSAQAAIVFETAQDYTIPANATASPVVVTTVTENSVLIPITVTQGITVANEAVGTSTGLPLQTFTLFNTGVIGGTVTISVNEGNGYQIWSEVTSLAEAGPADAVWAMAIDANGVVYINFGDNANGRIPDATAPIQATYRVGGGAASNVGANTIVTCLNSTLTAIASVTNTDPAVGGADPETISQIQDNAPQALTALSRCVSLNDYAAVALEFPAVTKASATSSVSTSVQLYVHPAGGPYSSTTLQEMISDPNVGLAVQLTNSSGTGWLDTRKPAGVTVTVLPPNYDGTPGYVPVIITVQVTVLPTYDSAQVQQNVVAAIVNGFQFGSMTFGQLITESSVWHLIQEVAGVDWLNLTELRRGDATAGTLGNVACAGDEIPLVTAIDPMTGLVNITVIPVGGL